MYNTKEDLIFALINEIGLSINSNNVLYDQDTHNIIYFGGKEIKCSIDPDKPVYKSEVAVVFDPIDDIKLMTTILGYYLEKERVLGETYPITYLTSQNKGKGLQPSNITVRLQTPDQGIIQVSSNFYYNKCLKIADIILRMGGQYCDLSNFDQK